MVAMVKRLRENWSEGYFIANNPHAFKNEIRDFVEGYMFENFFDKTATVSDKTWLRTQSEEYKVLRDLYGKRIFALSYGDPF